MLLSILIPSIKRHKVLLNELLSELQEQIERGDYYGLVEVLVDEHETDPTGRKRNRLLERSSGAYISFVDADDEVMSYYIQEILDAIKSDCDCIATIGYMTTDGANKIEWRLSKDYPNTTIFENSKAVYLRTANHLTPVKRWIALLAGFPNESSNGEDKAYSEKLNPFLKTEAKIDLPLYHYRYETCQKEYLK